MLFTLGGIAAPLKYVLPRGKADKVCGQRISPKNHKTRKLSEKCRWPLACGLKSFRNVSTNKKSFFVSSEVVTLKASWQL
jgi:hypothetical protein